MTLALGIIIILVAIALTVLVLMQSGKGKELSGAIAGGAETFFGKSKAKSYDKVLSKATTALSFVFVAVMVVLYIIAAK